MLLSVLERARLYIILFVIKHLKIRSASIEFVVYKHYLNKD